MDLAFTKDEMAFREEVRQFFKDNVPPETRRKLVEGHQAVALRGCLCPSPVLSAEIRGSSSTIAFEHSQREMVDADVVASLRQPARRPQRHGRAVVLAVAAHHAHPAASPG